MAQSISLYLGAARAALERSDLPAAVEQLAQAVALDPLAADLHPLLNQLYLLTPEPLALVPATNRMAYGYAALRAYFLGKIGNTAEAFSLLRQLASMNLGNGILDWALPWLDDGQLDDAQSAELARLLIGSTKYRFTNVVEKPPQQALLQRWLPHVRKAVAALPNDEHLRYGYYALLRKAGAVEEALREIRADYQRKPSYLLAVALSMACIAKGDIHGWYDACLQALEHSPDDLAIRKDLGDRLWDEARRPDEAEHWYAEVVERAQDDPWAQPSLLALKFLRTRDLKWREQLETLTLAHPDNRRARAMLDRATPYLGWLPGPEDALANLFRQFFEDWKKSNKEGPPRLVNVAVSRLEAPSNHLLFAVQMAALGFPNATIPVDVTNFGEPDARLPIGEVQYLLWRYDGAKPQQAVAPPSPQVARAIAELAVAPYGLWHWGRLGKRLAEQLGPASLDGLLGVMVHPPPLPKDWPAVWWILRVQLAAAMTIAHLDTGWTKSRRRRVLLDLLNGPLDWSIVAAAVALLWVAQNDRTAAEEVKRVLAQRRESLAKVSDGWYERMLIECELNLPNRTAAERPALVKLRRQLWQASQAGASAVGLAARQIAAEQLENKLSGDPLDPLVHLQIKETTDKKTSEKYLTVYAAVDLATKPPIGAVVAAVGRRLSSLFQREGEGLAKGNTVLVMADGLKKGDAEVEALKTEVQNLLNCKAELRNVLAQSRTPTCLLVMFFDDKGERFDMYAALLTPSVGGLAKEDP